VTKHPKGYCEIFCSLGTTESGKNRTALPSEVWGGKKGKSVQTAKELWADLAEKSEIMKKHFGSGRSCLEESPKIKEDIRRNSRFQWSS
jgi:hypothetical protein